MSISQTMEWRISEIKSERLIHVSIEALHNNIPGNDIIQLHKHNCVEINLLHLFFFLPQPYKYIYFNMNDSLFLTTFWQKKM